MFGWKLSPDRHRQPGVLPGQGLSARLAEQSFEPIRSRSRSPEASATGLGLSCIGVFHIVTQVAIIGAGPYGLSIAAHLRAHGVPYRIFGTPVDTWRRHMPAGMMLKSDGFASSLSDPSDEGTLAAYCAE